MPICVKLPQKKPSPASMMRMSMYRQKMTAQQRSLLVRLMLRYSLTEPQAQPTCYYIISRYFFCLLDEKFITPTQRIIIQTSINIKCPFTLQYHPPPSIDKPRNLLSKLIEPMQAILVQLVYQVINADDLYLLGMFNPQRRSKPSDIFMQQRAFKLHLDKVNSIRRSSSPPNQRTLSELQQQRYLRRLHNSKQEVKSRLSQHLNHENHRLLKKLVDTERRPQEYAETQSSQRHFNSYFNNKRQTERIRGDNFGIIQRMMNQSSMIPNLEEMKRDFKQNKRYEKMVRKLPAILKHEDSAKKEFTSYQTSRYNSKATLGSNRSGRGSRRSSDKAITHEIRHIQQGLIENLNCNSPTTAASLAIFRARVPSKLIPSSHPYQKQQVVVNKCMVGWQAMIGMVFFYISAPLLLGSREATIKELRESVIGRGLAKGSELNLSVLNFKMANLDTLMFSNDKSLRLENSIETLLKRIDRQYFDLSDKDTHEWWVKGEKELPVKRYFSEFTWNSSKFPGDSPIPTVISLFESRLATVENLLKTNTNQYNEAKTQLNQLVQKDGNYNVKDLSQVIAQPNVKAKNFHYTKFITTVVCVVPAVAIDYFNRNYWRVCNYVIPESAKKLNVPEKDGLTLWTVDLFTQKIDQYEPESDQSESDEENDKKAKKFHKKAKRYQTTVAEFIDKARQTLKITVREFKFESGQNEERKKKREAMSFRVQAQTNTLKQILKTQFSEIYELYIHTKIVRLIIESRMRFGSDKTVYYWLEPAQNKDKQVQTCLIEIFGDKDSDGLYGTKDEIDDGEDFFPFIYVPGITL